MIQRIKTYFVFVFINVFPCQSSIPLISEVPFSDSVWNQGQTTQFNDRTNSETKLYYYLFGKKLFGCNFSEIYQSLIHYVKLIKPDSLIRSRRSLNLYSDIHEQIKRSDFNQKELFYL